MKKVKEYLKMTDAFDELVNAVENHYGIANAIVELSSATLGDFVTLTHAQYAAHAINSHDELVNQRNELLKTLEAKKMIPAGWQLMPVAPTEEMVNSGHAAWSDGDDDFQSFAMAYSAMLSAAPKFEGDAA